MNMDLRQSQMQRFIEQGYLRIPGAVPKIMVDRALRSIHQSLGEGFPPDQARFYRMQSYCPELMKSAEIVDLALETPAWALAEALMGADNITPVSVGQIALRFPVLEEPVETVSPHLDGTYSPLNGVPEGSLRGFSMLLGVVLRDIEETDAGNLMVWPGSHHLYAQYFRQHGWESLLQGMPAVDLGKPVQVTAKAGDVLLVHYLLGHGTSANLSPNIRYTVYFRLRHREHDSAKSAVAPWRDFQHLADRVPGLIP